MSPLPSGRLLPRMATAAALLLLLSASGCGSVRRLFRPPDPPPPATWSAEIADSTRSVVAGPPFDSTGVGILEPEDTAQGTRRTESAPPRPADPTTAPAETIPADLEPVEADSLEETIEGQPSVSVALTDAEKLKLRHATEEDLRVAELSVTATAERVRTEEQKQKLRTVRGLIDQARKAYAQEDLQAAANLAHKARLLADELAATLPPR